MSGWEVWVCVSTTHFTILNTVGCIRGVTSSTTEAWFNRLIHQTPAIEWTNSWKQELENVKLDFNLQLLVGNWEETGLLTATGCRLSAWSEADNTESSKITPNPLFSSYLTECWVGFTPPPLRTPPEDTRPTRPATLPRYLCEFPGAHHPVPAGDSETPGVTQQVVVRSAHKSVGIPCHWAIQVMKDRHFVAIIIVVSKPLAQSAKKHFQSNLAGENKKKNYWFFLNKDLGLQGFNSQNSDTTRTRKLCCLCKSFVLPLLFRNISDCLGFPPHFLISGDIFIKIGLLVLWNDPVQSCIPWNHTAINCTVAKGRGWLKGWRSTVRLWNLLRNITAVIKEAKITWYLGNFLIYLQWLF